MSTRMLGAPAAAARRQVIIQNFRAKQGTAMAAAPEPPLEELLWTVAVARLILGPRMNIQVRALRVSACGLGQHGHAGACAGIPAV